MAELRLYKLHAALCHALANYKRLEIIDTLQDSEMTVSELASALKISQPNLSQHLALMRERGILTSRREGLNVYYRLSNPKVLQAYQLMLEVLAEKLESDARLARSEASRIEIQA